MGRNQITLGLYLRTARYYRPSQIANRFRLAVNSVLSRRLGWLNQRRYGVPADLAREKCATFFDSGEVEYDGKLDRSREMAWHLEQGIFRLLNKEVTLGSPVRWDPAGTTRLWRYNLHYFDYALDLALLVKFEKDEKSADLLRRLFREWIEANPVSEGVGWHSYPTSRRIVNWIQAVSLATSEVVFCDSQSEMAWMNSVYQQARYLEDHLEFDLTGNHLLANAKALVYAGLFFGDIVGAHWSSIGQRLLWHGLKEQILNDGGHYERSPMYHAIVLQDYLETVLALRLNRIEVPAWVHERLISMADFLTGIVHPDGEIPLFADSALGIASRPSDILAAAEVLLNVQGRWPNANPGLFCALFAPQAFKRVDSKTLSPPIGSLWPSTGYFALSGGSPGDRMIVDAKPMGPNHLPGHGHCSLFSYELSIAGKRFIVDSGVEEYESGPWRDFWRSTRAHNTVVVDGREQSEIWAAYRVGQRTRLLQSAIVQHESSSLFVGVHCGFVGQKSPTRHRRFIAAFAEGLWLILDEVAGSGLHTIESFVHLAPNAICQVGENLADVALESVRMRFYPLISDVGHTSVMTCIRGLMDPIQGWYAPELGKREPNTVLSFSSRVELPTEVGYLIAPAGREITAWGIKVNHSVRSTQFNVSIRSSQGDIVEQFEVVNQLNDSQ